MPKTITETSRSKRKEACAPPVPECNLSKRDIERFSRELTKYMKQFAPAFECVEQMKHSQVYVHGLLSDVTRKHVEQMALGSGEKVRSLQYFVGQSPWAGEAVTAIHQGLIGETLGEVDGIALIDESSTVKQGEDSVGKIANPLFSCHIVIIWPDRIDSTAANVDLATPMSCS